MKKEYIQPQITMETIQPSVLLSASNLAVIDLPADVEGLQEGGGFMLSPELELFDNYVLDCIK